MAEGLIMLAAWIIIGIITFFVVVVLCALIPSKEDESFRELERQQRNHSGYGVIMGGEDQKATFSDIAQAIRRRRT
jgi:hypothetical protein